MPSKQPTISVVINFASFSAKLFTLLIANVFINSVPALAQKIPISNDGIFLESSSVEYKGKFVYFQTETINQYVSWGNGDVRRTVVNHVMDCKTGYWQITRAIGYRDSFTEPNIDFTDEFQGRTFFAEPNTPFGNVYQALCR
jgi:hypothetical protein